MEKYDNIDLEKAEKHDPIANSSKNKQNRRLSKKK